MPLIWQRVWRESLPERSRRERLGHIPDYREERVLWVHAASVGEVTTARSLIRSLIDDYPEHRVVVTTMTATGARQLVTLFADLVTHHFLPLDFPGAAHRFIERLQPELGLIVDTELWPNLIHAASDAGTPLAVVNGRITPKAFRRYRRFDALMRESLSRLVWVGAKSGEDAKRFRTLGVEARNLTVTGALKFDLDIDETRLGAGEALRASWGDRPVWIAASTHDGEEQAILEAHRQVLSQLPDALLILVPRHPQRFDTVYETCLAEAMTTVRRSRQEGVRPETQVYLGDTMGELMLLYACADMAFVGGSWLEDVGGHNLLEPAALGVPVLSGPCLESLREVADALVVEEARREVADGHALGRVLLELFDNPAERERLGTVARSLVDAHRGALALTRRHVARLIEARRLAYLMEEEGVEPPS
ncbi:3-deoxy-D-manno-octulosonic acid transferase [Kushneria phosphatilytica]|uniref:3-deoxy-D-manno-octulosonic acid transferase n=2 Tax=Kushneria phosphatilytica TaxID=657387 RepID=A0A1S1NU72_9GAMM|nr:3-deoxy-D-manno-octulosonic acid transferase [Kushneria phosphatilytica]QEL12640.1 3-deoxy-D-manno-octulosonic acid transferase [Kushneria phosphatilytica]